MEDSQQKCAELSKWIAISNELSSVGICFESCEASSRSCVMLQGGLCKLSAASARVF
jgi:hypothetical protein